MQGTQMLIYLSRRHVRFLRLFPATLVLESLDENSFLTVTNTADVFHQNVSDSPVLIEEIGFVASAKSHKRGSP